MALEIMADTRIRATATFVALNASTPGDPTVVSFAVQDPNRAMVTKTFGVDAEVIKDAVGVYHLDFVPANIDGMWYVQARAQGSTGINAVVESGIRVRGLVIA